MTPVTPCCGATIRRIAGPPTRAPALWHRCRNTRFADDGARLAVPFRLGGPASSRSECRRDAGRIPRSVLRDPMTESAHARFGSGKAVRRVEDDSLLTGGDQFADNFALPGQVRLLVLRSPHPHARIAAIDTTAARALPGVVTILTGEDLVRAGVKPLPQSGDFRRRDGGKTAAPPQHALAVGTVRYVGEALAAVFAESIEQARDALEAIDVRYEPLPMVADLADAIDPGAPVVWPDATGNVACEARHGDRAAAAAAFAKAAHVVTLDLGNQRVAPAPVPPGGNMGGFGPATDRITMRVSCQTPTGLRDDLCKEVLG